MGAELLEPFAVIGLCVALFGGGFALALWTVRPRPDPARMTFHWPRPDVCVVEVRTSRCTFEQLEHMRDQLREKLGADVLCIVLDANEREF